MGWVRVKRPGWRLAKGWGPGRATVKAMGCPPLLDWRPALVMGFRLARPPASRRTWALQSAPAAMLAQSTRPALQVRRARRPAGRVAF
jgi:hypothetical protein